MSHDPPILTAELWTRAYYQVTTIADSYILDKQVTRCVK